MFNGLLRFEIFWCQDPKSWGNCLIGFLTTYADVEIHGTGPESNLKWAKYNNIFKFEACWNDIVIYVLISDEMTSQYATQWKCSFNGPTQLVQGQHRVMFYSSSVLCLSIRHHNLINNVEIIVCVLQWSATHSTVRVLLYAYRAVRDLSISQCNLLVDGQIIDV